MVTGASLSDRLCGRAPSTKPPAVRVLIDGRPLQGASAVRGIGSYARGLITGFAELENPPEVSLLLSAHREPPPEVSAGVSSAPRRIRVVHPTIQPNADALFVAWALRGARADLYHAIEFGQPLRTRLPVVVTVHDLIPFVLPRDYPWVRRARLLGLRLLSRADAVIAVSEATRRDVLRLTRTSPQRVTVVPEGISPVFRAAPSESVAALRARLGIDRPFLLAVGTFDPRKRIALLADVVRQVRFDHDVLLVIAGDQGSFANAVAEALSHAGITEHCRLIGHVSTDDLVTLYTGAACLVFTSAYEGFGLPPLEAMACGTPAAVFDNSSLREVSGTAAMLIPDGDARLMAEAVRGLLDDPAEHDRRRADGLAWAATFTWSRAAARTIEVYRTAIEG
jgi:glycosyltransferase involved in cell wall biosynthesis